MNLHRSTRRATGSDALRLVQAAGTSRGVGVSLSGNNILLAKLPAPSEGASQRVECHLGSAAECLGVGKVHEAIAHLKTAYDTGMRSAGRASMLAIGAADRVAQLFWTLEDRPSAIEWARKSLDLAAAIGSVSDRILAHSRLGLYEACGGDVNSADSHVCDAHTLLGEQSRISGKTYSVFLNASAAVAERRGNHLAAVNYLSKLYDLIAKLGEDDPDFRISILRRQAAAESNLAVDPELSERAAFAERAVKTLTVAIEISAKQVLARDSEMVQLLVERASLFLELQRCDVAGTDISVGEKIASEKFGTTSIQYSWVLEARGRLHGLRGRPAEARNDFLEAARLGEMFRVGSDVVAARYEHAADAARRGQDLAGMEDDFRAALRVVSTCQETTPLQMAYARLNVASAMLNLIPRRSPNPDHVDTLCEAAGLIERSINSLARLAKSLPNSGAERERVDAEFLRAMFLQAKALTRQGTPESACTVLKLVEKSVEQRGQAETLFMALVFHEHGIAADEMFFRYNDESARSEALEFCTRAAELYERLGEDKDSCHLVLLKRIVELCELECRYSDVNFWRTKADDHRAALTPPEDPDDPDAPLEAFG